MASEQLKQKRIDLRTTARIKNILTRAAELAGVSISTFMTQAAYEKAKKIISMHEIITLSDMERDQFLSILEKPAKPNAKLKAAMQEYLTRDN